MANPIFIIDIGPDGVVAAHPERTQLPVLVAPVPEGKKAESYNTIRSQLVAIGCMQLPGAGFEFDSSFISPQSANRFTKFARLMQSLKAQDPAGRFPPCSVFGHADPTGDDEYNKTLSGRRARAVYALLTRKFKIWDYLFNNSLGGDQWGMRSIRMMLSIPLQKGEPQFYWGPIEPGPDKTEQDRVQKLTHAELVEYQRARKLPASGFPNDPTREKLFQEYMNAICRDPHDQAFSLDPERDFIAKGKDKDKTYAGSGLKGDVQGCGDFNEIFLLTKAEDDEAQKDKTKQAARNELYRVDRRVLVYIFKHGTEIDFNHWPCPRSSEESKGCTLRFWSDYKDRRKRTAERRTFGKKMDLFQRDESGNLVLDGNGNPTQLKVEETGNTMACRWYHAFAVHSPCERKTEEWVVRIHLDSVKTFTQPLVGRRYVVFAGETESSAVMRGTTNEQGEIRIPVFDEHTRMTVKLDAWGELFTFDNKTSDGKTGGNGDGSSQDNQKPDPVTGAFPDEDKFMTLQLDAGALRQMTAASDELPSKQRLFNLGYGIHSPDEWTDEQFKDAVAEYRHSRTLGESNTLDDKTRQRLVWDHEVSDPGPQPDDTDGPQTPASNDDAAAPNP